MNRKSKILVVEDEEAIRDLIALNLETEGYAVITAQNGQEAIELFEAQKFDAIVLDVMMPEINGFDVCKIIRLTNHMVPVLFLSAKSNSGDRIEGLKLGADDYMTKPFSLEEFLLRIKKLVTRYVSSGNNTILAKYKTKNWEINFDSFEIINVRKERHKLSKKEIQLLRLLINEKGKVVSRNQILDLVWGVNSYPSTRTIDNFILNFRKHFEVDSKKPIQFISVRGVGYSYKGDE